MITAQQTLTDLIWIWRSSTANISTAKNTILYCTPNFQFTMLWQWCMKLLMTLYHHRLVCSELVLNNDINMAKLQEVSLTNRDQMYFCFTSGFIVIPLHFDCICTFAVRKEPLGCLESSGHMTYILESDMNSKIFFFQPFQRNWSAIDEVNCEKKVSDPQQHFLSKSQIP